MKPTLAMIPRATARRAAGRALRARSVASALAAAVLAACGGGHDEARKAAEATSDAQRELAAGQLHIDPLSFTKDGVRISRSGGPDALVTADGAFEVDGQDVALTPEQKALFAKYYESAYAMRSHAIDTGLAGVDVAKTAVGEVLGGLMKGDTSQIEKNVQKSAEGVKAAAFELCGDLEQIAAVESQLASLEAFAPYRFVDQAKIDDCRRETAPAAVTAPAAPTAPTAPAASTLPAAPAAPPAPDAATH
jgi:hypothetical protein